MKKRAFVLGICLVFGLSLSCSVRAGWFSKKTPPVLNDDFRVGAVQFSMTIPSGHRFVGAQCVQRVVHGETWAIFDVTPTVHRKEAQRTEVVRFAVFEQEGTTVTVHFPGEKRLPLDGESPAAAGGQLLDVEFEVNFATQHETNGWYQAGTLRLFDGTLEENLHLARLQNLEVLLGNTLDGMVFTFDGPEWERQKIHNPRAGCWVTGATRAVESLLIDYPREALRQGNFDALYRP